MTRKLFAPILAIALAASPLSVTPASAASGDDIAKALLGATALFVIVNGLDNSERPRARHVDRRPAPQYYRLVPAPRGPRWARDAHRHDRWEHRQYRHEARRY
jgi:hypothetical protein